MSPVLALALTGCAVVPLVTRPASWPDRSAVVPVEGVEAPVVLLRDESGIAHVRASSEVDAWYGLGWAHAQDRLFQADMARRFAYGGLSELVGERAVELDAFMLGLNLRARATDALDAMDPAARTGLRAYVEGMNAGIVALERPPIEHRVLGAAVAPWTEEDCLSLVFLNAWSLSNTLGEELAALALRDRLDAAGLNALLGVEGGLDPVDPGWDALAASLELGPVVPGFSALSGVAPSEPAASNNWAVSGARSGDRMPILANDPHLPQRVPSLWYIAELRGGDLHVAGATLPGAPLVVIGHNERVAWGLTNLMADDLDLALVERVGERGYRLDGEDRELVAVTVEVPLPKGEVATRTVWWTDIGPVVTELEGSHLAVMQWTALQVVDRTAELFLGLNHARDVEAAVAATELPTIVAQNLMIADVDGHIGLQRFGTLPARLGHTGGVPYDASAVGSGWDGWQPRIAAVIDPEDGVLHTANARPDLPEADAITTQFAAAWRDRRIDEVLAGGDGLTVQDMTALQLDRVDSAARAAIPVLLDGVSPSTAAARQCFDLIGGWNAEAAPWSVGATAYYTFERAIVLAALGDELGADAEIYQRVGRPVEALVGGRLNAFIDSRAAVVDQALDAACTSLNAELGEDTDAWAWGERHALELRHPFGGSFPLKGWNMDRIPYGGSADTVNAAGASPTWGVSYMASLRLVVPLADPGSALVAHPGGQSGHPGEPHYRDLYAPFAEGEYAPLWFDDVDVESHAVEALVLTPR